MGHSKDGLAHTDQWSSNLHLIFKCKQIAKTLQSVCDVDISGLTERNERNMDYYRNIKMKHQIQETLMKKTNVTHFTVPCWVENLLHSENCKLDKKGWLFFNHTSGYYITTTGRTYKLNTARPQTRFKALTFLLCGNGANHNTTMVSLGWLRRFRFQLWWSFTLVSVCQNMLQFTDTLPIIKVTQVLGVCIEEAPERGFPVHHQLFATTKGFL